jgi:hypothetical protein
MTQYEGYASRWVNKTYAKWLKDLKDTLVGFNDEMFVHSLHHAEKTQAKKKNSLSWELRCLNKGSLCSSALIALLGRLIGLKPQGGGLESEVVKNAARDLLTSLIRALLMYSPLIYKNESDRYSTFYIFSRQIFFQRMSTN